mmetsp:Transcript_3954/g.5595  ORF Transcript_3954/g.5595 Transcript_3954/m.5595 type:complete len:116 (-) Transcript_3954:379-726(-)
MKRSVNRIFHQKKEEKVNPSWLLERIARLLLWTFYAIDKARFRYIHVIAASTQSLICCERVRASPFIELRSRLDPNSTFDQFCTLVKTLPSLTTALQSNTAATVNDRRAGIFQAG